MNLFAKDQPRIEYEAPAAADEAFGQRRIAINFNAGEYKIERGAGMKRETVESGPVCPEAQGNDSREARAIRKTWLQEKIESVREIAETEKLSFSAGQGFSSLANADYR